MTTNYIQNQLKLESEFQGIGPRAGMDISVHAGSGISFVGSAGGSLLIGDLDSKFDNDFYGVLASQNSSTHYKNDDAHHVVPELDARVGIDYAFAYSPNTSLNVQVGYQAVNYFDVVAVDVTDTITPNTLNNTSNFGYYGPYLRGVLTFV